MVKSSISPTIADNYLRIQDQIHSACADAGRSPNEVTLLAVTKTVDAARINAAIDLGVKENTEIKIHPSVFDFEVWAELSDEYQGRLHIVMSDSPIVKFKKQKGENVPELLFKFFTRYQEILKEYI